MVKRSRSPDREDLVISRLGYKFGITQEKAFLTGSGAGQPLRVTLAMASGLLDHIWETQALLLRTSWPIS